VDLCKIAGGSSFKDDFDLLVIRECAICGDHATKGGKARKTAKAFLTVEGQRPLLGLLK